MSRRRIAALLAVAAGVPALVLGVEVLLARSTGGRLDDELGERPRQELLRAGDRPVQVIWLGDSTTTGVGADPASDGMAWRVARDLTDGPVSLTVLGRSGDQVHEVLDHQLPQLADVLRPGRDLVVLVSIGANDVTALTRRPTFQDRYRTMVERIREVLEGHGAPDAPVVLVGVPALGTAPRLLPPLRQLAGARASQLDDVIADVARDVGAHHVDLAARTGPVFASDPARYFAGDDYHPSSAGHAVWADAVVASIRDARVPIGGPVSPR
ncbi:MAG TPA: SGNH/GDSL hydrolase family protein [Acidimicrobiales bacterium]|nr:SGNH/GDSL hydrolase family protein [Acidimicrobiales bacterium]